MKTVVRHAYTGQEIAAEYAGLAAVLIAEIQDRSRFWHWWRYL